MPYTVDQIEKHTIVTRLSVSIYKMNDEQLNRLLDILDPAFSNQPGRKLIARSLRSNETLLNRHIIIARLFVVIKKMDKVTLLTKLASFEHPDFHWVREFPRIACFLLVDFATKGKVYQSCIRDISASGVFIETSELFEIGQEVALCYSLSESNETLPFKIKGKITRIYPDGIGVQYKNVTKYQREIINTILRKIS